MAVPRTWYPTAEHDLLGLDIRLPAIVKPTVSIALQYAIGRKALPARTHMELVQQYRLAATVVDPASLMVQEIIPGDGRTQYSVAAFCTDGQVVNAMTARRTRQYPLDYGLSSSFVEAIEVPRLLELATRLLNRLRVSGMVEVEFKHDGRDGRDKLLDVNVRAWGWHTLCIACGLDFPYMQYRAALGQAVETVRPRYGRCWRRLITDIPAILQELRRASTIPRHWLPGLRHHAVPSVLDYRDPLPAVWDLWISLSRSFKRGSRGHAPLSGGSDHRPLRTADAVDGEAKA
jgi:predicted ATP-grasp superfamily ATP-dependent carboligase